MTLRVTGHHPVNEKRQKHKIRVVWTMSKVQYHTEKKLSHIKMTVNVQDNAVVLLANLIMGARATQKLKKK